MERLVVDQRTGFFFFRVTPGDKRGLVGATVLADGLKSWQGFLIELWITLILVITVLGSTNKCRKKDLRMFVIPIGLAVALGIMVAVSLHDRRAIGVRCLVVKFHFTLFAGVKRI